MNHGPPPDRSHIATEGRNPRTIDLHAMTIGECVRTITAEDEAVHEAMRQARPALTELIEGVVPRFLAGGRLVYIGAGTSGRLGVLDASEAPPTFQLQEGRIIGIIAGGDHSLRRSSEGLEDDAGGASPALEAMGLGDNDSVIGIAAGGTTPYVLGALQIASETAPACLRALITCSPVPRPRQATHLVLLDTGPEVLTGSTRMKAGTATKMALNTISTTVMVQCGKVYQNLMVDLRASNDKLRDRAARIVSVLTGVSRQEAFALLNRADGSAKVAIVMHRLGLGRDEAVTRLEGAGGRLHVLLDNTPTARS